MNFQKEWFCLGSYGEAVCFFEPERFRDSRKDFTGVQKLKVQRGFHYIFGVFSYLLKVGRV